MGIGARVKRTVQFQPGRKFVGRFPADHRLIDGLRTVIRRVLGIEQRTVLDEAALFEILREVLREKRQQKQARHGPRLNASSVKSPSFIGRLYSSWSYLSVVRLLRVTSATSIVRAVQMPFASSKSR